MKNDGLRRLPPPPLFTIRPPPKPPGLLFDNFQTVQILNGQCVRSSLNILSSPSTILQKHEQQPINWLNIFLLILAVISVISCIIIAIFIFICLKKLRKEEKQYKNYVMSGTLSSKYNHHHHISACTRTSEHYKCTSNKFNCCDDYYSHQLIPTTNAPPNPVIKSSDIPQLLSTGNVVDGQDTPLNHQYESIPEYLLTMTRHPPPPPIVCHHAHQLYQQMHSKCGAPYSNFSRLYLTPQEITTTNVSECTFSLPPSTTIVQEESSTPLLASNISKESYQREETSSPKSMMIGWTRRNPSSTAKRKPTEKRHSFLSQLRRSSIL